MVLALCAVIVFVTTYILILPALTLDEEEALQQGGIDVPGASAFEGKGFEVTANWSEDAALPEGTELQASQIKESDEDYQAWCDEALAALQAQDPEPKAGVLGCARFYDISMISEGEEIEPAAPVDVKISFDKALPIGDEKNVRVIHFAADERGNLVPEVLDPDDVTLTVKKDQMTATQFKAESFSVYAVVSQETAVDPADLVGNSYAMVTGTNAAMLGEPHATQSDRLKGIQVNPVVGGTLQVDGSMTFWTFEEVPDQPGWFYISDGHGNYINITSTSGNGGSVTLGEKLYKGKPRLVPLKQHAVNFIIDTVRANPHQVTIAAIAPLGNLAAAVRMAPDIVPLIKRVVYMGGAFFQPGNVTPAAEFNWWFDPEAAQIVVRSPFAEQVYFGLDVCEKVVFRKEHYDRLLKTLGKGGQATILRNTFVGKQFEKDPAFTHYVWDVLVSAYIIDPSIVTKSVKASVDINTQYGLGYGQSMAFQTFAPPGTQKGVVIMDVDQDKFWNMVNDKTYWKSVREGR